MDLVKILVFVVAFLLLLLLGRLLSASSEVHAHQLPYDGGGTPLPVVPIEQEAEPSSREVLTGAEVGFPFSLPPVTEDEKGRFNRPYYTNYYFSKTDLVRGPVDPRSFHDELYLVAQDPVSSHTWERKFIVATPAGLQELMNQEQYVSLYFEDDVVLVTEWNLSVILQTVIEEELKRYGAIDDGETLSPPEAGRGDIG